MEEKNRTEKTQTEKTQTEKTGEGKNDWRGLVKKWFRRDNLVIMVLAGILLFIIALPTKESEKTNVSGRGEALHGQSMPGSDADGTAGSEEVKELQEAENTAGNEISGQMSLEEYAAAQEKKLESLLSSMAGVGEVRVMLTFVSSEELVVEKDAPVMRSNTVEKDSEGGTRTVTSYEQGDSTVYRSSSGESKPYVVKTLNPRVEGILVVAEGAGDGTVNSNITEIAQALFGVEAHRVKVVSMKSP